MNQPDILDRMGVQFRCTKCDAAMGQCDCWEKCSCGHTTERGKPCNNPNTTRCSTKYKYGPAWLKTANLLKPGTVVRTPEGGLYGGRPAIVLSTAGQAVTVSTGSATLVYDALDLTPLAHIVINVKRYGTTAGARLNRCRVEFVSGRTPVTLDVVTRGKGALGEETRALEVRKLCFLDLTRGIYE